MSNEISWKILTVLGTSQAISECSSRGKRIFWKHWGWAIGEERMRIV